MCDYFYWLSVLYFIVLFISQSPFLTAEPKPVTLASWLFYMTAILGQFFLYAVFVSGLNVLIIYLVGNTYLIKLGNGIIFSVVWLFILSNSKIYARYRFNINFTILKLTFGKGAGEVVQHSSEEYSLFLFVVLLVFISSVFFEFSANSLVHWSFLMNIVPLVFWLAAVIYFFNQLVYCFLLHKDCISITQYAYKVFGYTLMCWARCFVKLSQCQSGVAYQVIRKMQLGLSDSSMQYPMSPIQRKKFDTKPYNILMLCVDSCRFDMLNQINMPHVYTFSRRSHVFNEHWSNGNATQPGIFSLFYGLTPNYWNATLKNNTPPIFIEQMHEMDYQMAIYASANLNNPPFSRNVFHGIHGLKTSSSGSNPLQRDKSITQDMNYFLNHHDHARPFFGFLFYDSAHGNYSSHNLPKKFTPTAKMNRITVSARSNPEPIFNQYKNAVFAIDQMIGSVLDTLKSCRLLDSTVVVITSDHGQEFNDLKKNFWEHLSNFSQYQVKVPLVVYHPNQGHKQYHHRTCHVDVAPTIARRVLGVMNPFADFSVGKDLYEIVDTPFVIAANYTDYSLVNAEHIVNFQKSGNCQVYDHGMNHIHKSEWNSVDLLSALDMMTDFHHKRCDVS